MGTHPPKRAKGLDQDHGYGPRFSSELQTQRAEKKEQELEQKKQAEAAQQKMHDNLLLMQRRGEQINEMGSKATELNEGAKNYGSMAKQLKEKSKNSWLPF
jgi:hypothetical protein